MKMGVFFWTPITMSTIIKYCHYYSINEVNANKSMKQNTILVLKYD